VTYADVVATLRAAGCVFAEDEAMLLIDAGGSLRSLVERRAGGEPLEYVVGWADFCGLRIHVEAGVFVPRRRTELLARQAAALASPGAIVVDLCCGTGAVGAVVRAMVPSVEVHAADVEPVAVRCARVNLGEHVHQGDLYDALPSSLRGNVSVLVANAPYVPTDEIALMPPEARDHEPPVTLDGGSDGLDVLRRIVSQADEWLAPGGHLLFETSRGQVPVALQMFEGTPFVAHVLTDYETGSTMILSRAG
jgi:release factor glutamine methyltransferase